MRAIVVIVGLVPSLGLVLAACAPAQVTAPTPAAAPPGASAAKPEYKVLRLSIGAGDLPTLDPALAEDTTSFKIIEEAFIGLTYLDPVTSETRPAMATSWDVLENQDGTQSITFHLRDDVPWVRWNGAQVETVKTCDGSADRIVTAQDFAYGIQRNLNPANASPYAYVWGFVLQGADDYSMGVTDDFSTVGVNVLDDHTLELTYLAPAAYNVQIAGMSIGRPQPRWVIEGDCAGAVEAMGERWTEPGFFESYGPYTVSEWVHDSEIVIIKNPFWPGTEAVQVPAIDEIRFRMLDRSPAFLEYEAGNLDAADLPSVELDRVKADAVLSRELEYAPELCSTYLGFNTTADYVDDVRVRRALSMAIDRQSLVDNVLKGGEQPAQWFGRPGLAAAPTMDTHPDLGIKYDPEAAKLELQSYLDEMGLTADQLHLTSMTVSSERTQAIAEAMQYMWSAKLGLTVQVVSQEWAVYLDTIGGPDTPQIWGLAWCHDYPDENNFIREVFAFGGSSNPRDGSGNPGGGVMWKNDAFEELVSEAALETDVSTRRDLYAQAEKILVDTDAVIIPLWWNSRSVVIKPYVQHTLGVGAVDPLHLWDILPE